RAPSAMTETGSSSAYEVVPPGRTRVGGYALCTDDDGRVLLARLSAIEVDVGAWTLPGGGIDFGEHPDDAVIRELAEETGLVGEAGASGRTTLGIDVGAPAALVFRLARDVERWPALLPHYVRARRLAGPDPDGRLQVAFIARRSMVPIVGLGLPVAWRAWTWAEPAACHLRFVHRGGATNGMDVTWRIAD